MNDNHSDIYRTTKGLNFIMSNDIYEKLITNDEDGLAYSIAETYIHSEQYFPQLIQFIFVLVYMLNGYHSFIQILLLNLIVGIIATLLWNKTKLYRIPGVALLSEVLGIYIFNRFLHILAIALLSIFHFKNIWIIIYCIISGIITQIIKTLISSHKSMLKHNNDIAIYSINMLKNSNNYKIKKSNDEVINVSKIIDIFNNELIPEYFWQQQIIKEDIINIDWGVVKKHYMSLLDRNLYLLKMLSNFKETNVSKSLFASIRFFEELLQNEIKLADMLKLKSNGEDFDKKDIDNLLAENDKLYSIISMRIDRLIKQNNVELTKIQIQLIELLKSLNINKTNAIGIMLTLKHDNQISEMIKYITENKNDITEEAILEYMLIILDKDNK